ncbi:hypothetical protein [Leifsonia sp. C5G2]|uniref:hypothetical protein n=1 Tax=Leifsonia sp. C5G2 TaxID=2735269 RepID=UPI001585056E|nr:hypothetical protein [Leifsonia sp. C5G2]NUU05928.1 hypothetical protein [Leifsonia sp. C5G2]
MTDQGMPAGAFPPPMPGAPEPEPKRAIKPWMWWAGGGGLAFVALAVVAGVVGVNLVAGAGGGAKATAQQYLDAIAKGDAAAASTLARVDTKDEDNALLTGQALSKAERITAVSVGEADKSARSDRTYVPVKFKLSGKSYSWYVYVDRDDKGWFVSEGLAGAVPSAPYKLEYKVVGSDVVVGDKADGLRAYPGVYGVSPSNKYFTLAGDKKFVISPEFDDFDFALAPSDAYIEEAQEQVNAHFDACAAKTTFDDVEDCGISLDYPDDIPTSKANAAVTIVEYPRVLFSDRGIGMTSGSFTARISGPNYSGEPAVEDVTGEIGYVRLHVAFAKGKLVATVD